MSGFLCARGIEPAPDKRDVDAFVYDWDDAFVAEALRHGLGAVAVADHHDGAFLPDVIAAAKRLGPVFGPPR
ncbi:hypothetical protein MKK88_05010 [Methylobacterium sp. E-005]|uniref:hypothetical protein n=1 Tax=Methylobacterium sp. E-005 TaxID=2836549 RepID=UPI001FBABE40|nr:hypothetical protein [Methylobacterium sp. E-005]MCJ2085355.1 hypothetical protein [Methylobacterium sp. E-005]